jgi:hypothetical protein
MRRIVIQPVRRWQAGGASILLVHHHGKPSEQHPRSGTDRVRGSSALAGAIDTNIQLIQDNRDKGYCHLELTKLRRWAPRKRLNLALDPDRLIFRMRSAEVIILQTVEDMTEMSVPALAAMIGAATGLDHSTIYRHVTHLVSTGRLAESEQPSAGGRPVRVVKLPNR